MEWINIFESFFHNIVSMSKKNCKMSFHDKGGSNNLFPGQYLLGKIVTSASATCCLTNTKNVPTCNQLAHTSPSLLRLNSQGESCNSEDDFSFFPSVEPRTADNMDKSRETNVGCNPMWGLPKPLTSGFKSVPWNHVPKCERQYPFYSSCTRNMDFPQQDVQYSSWQSPRLSAWQVPHKQPSYFNHGMVPTASANITPSGYNSGVFQFKGQNTNGYRTPMQGKKCHTTFYQGHSQKHNRGKPHSVAQHKPMSSLALKNQETQDCGSGQPLDIVRNVTQKMFGLDISSEICDSHKHSSSSGHTDDSGNAPTVKMSSLESSQKTLKSSSVHDSNNAAGLATNYVNTELSLVSDLCDLSKSAQGQDDSIEWQQLHQETSKPSSTVPNTTSKCNAKKLQDSKIPEIQTACIVLTPKTPCSGRKKKGRPSSKKRHRRKLQQCAQGQIINISARQSKKQKIQSPGATDKTAHCHESMSFVIDFSESDYSETEPQSCTSPRAGTSPIAAKFSWFISAGELSDDEDTDSEEFSDSDFFDEVNTQTTTPVKESANKSSTASPNWQSVFQDVGCLSPFTFQITCITTSSDPDSSRLTVPSEDQIDSGQSASHDNDNVDPDSKQRLDNANAQWQLHYGQASVQEKSGHSKVHFPTDESHLQTVFTLNPEEVEAYREARVGKWEEFARDRQRFKDRIEETEKTVSRCFLSSHRDKMYTELYG